MTKADPPWFALVESNTTGSGRLFCAAARARDMRPVVLTADPTRYPYLADDGIEVLVVDTADGLAIRAACRRLAADRLVGVTSSSEYFAATAAAVASELGLPAPDPAAVAGCRRKDQQRAALAAAGVPGPAVRVAASGCAAVQAAEQLGWPVVVKPVAGSGSVGVRRCGCAGEVESWVEELLRGRAGGNGRVLIEQYVAGPEFSVEVFDGAVIGVVAKHLGPLPYFVETGHDYPAPIDERDRAALARTGAQAVRVLRLGWGAVHVEMRLTADGPKIIEVNPRLAGGMIPTAVALSGGVDLVAAVVARASGQPTSPGGAGLGHAAIRFLLASSAGQVRAAGGTEAALGVPGVRLAVLTVAPGGTVEITHSFRDRLGYVIATGPSSSAAASRAEYALSQLAVTVARPAYDSSWSAVWAPAATLPAQPSDVR